MKKLKIQNFKIRKGIFQYLYHPRLKKLNITEHFRERLLSRRVLFPKDLLPHMKGFTFHNGDNPNCFNKVVRQKILNGVHLNIDYLINKQLDLILIVDRNTNNIITCIDSNTDYYKN